VRDEVRRVTRYPAATGIEEEAEHADASASPLDEAIGKEAVDRYEQGLQRLRPEERELIIARVEMQQSYAQIAAAHGKASPDAARMAVTRALVRLAEEMDVEG
jgi:RNA polymerase sigma-70 factor (ECF subfamily)